MQSFSRLLSSSGASCKRPVLESIEKRQMLSITPQWIPGLTQGAGWIAIALVIFAFWRPTLCLVGAYFFGAFSGIPVTFQARGILSSVPPELFQALPYVMTVIVLVLVSTAGARRRLGAPAALGTPYVREER